MPYEPLVLLHRLAPEDVNQLVRHNHPPPPPVINQQQNVQTLQNNEGSSTQSLEEDIDPNKNLTSDLNGTKHVDNLKDKSQQETFSKQPNIKKNLKFHSNKSLAEKKKKFTSEENPFKKELIVVIDNCYNDMIRDMVNSTAQHPKTRNPTTSTVAINSNNNTNNIPITPTQDQSHVNEHITDETIMITTTKSPLSTITPVIEVIDKKIKEVSLNNQLQMTAEELDKKINNDKVHNDSSGLSLRTRTISSTTVPTALHQSTVSTVNSVIVNCSTSTITGPRPRGRRPRQKNRINLKNRKSLQQTSCTKSEENKVCDLTSSITEKESANGLKRLQQQHLSNKYNGIENYNNEHEYSNQNDASSIININNQDTKLLQDIDTTKECTVDSLCSKKSITRKRKLSGIEEEPIAEKRSLITDKPKDSSVININVLKKSSENTDEVEMVSHSFLTTCFTVQPNRQCTNLKALSSARLSTCYGRTYWPINWEYSASALTGHVQKKAPKDILRKIRLICGVGTNTKSVSMLPPLKTNSMLKKYQSSVIQRRGSTSKLSSLGSVEMSSGLKHPSTSSIIVKRKKGRPPGRKNKVLQAVIKSNSPRKSPRQHASTLAAIMSNKVSNIDDNLLSQPDKIVDGDTECTINSVDMDGPCVLPIAVPKHERKPGVRHYRRRRQLDHQHSILERRCRRRSITPPPPKLCAQQPAPQRNHIHSVDHEVVKLRTKHVDVVRRRARDERLRSAYVCQQLHKVYEIAEKNRHDLFQDYDDDDDNDDNLSNYPKLPENIQHQIWSSQVIDNNQEPDNMCLQLMYEQTGDIKFLHSNLTKETLQMYHQQRDLAMAERLTNNNDTIFSDLGTDIVSTGNKRKKKRPNMTGWPKEKRRKTIAIANSTMNTDRETINNESDIERENIAKRRRAAAAEQQRLRRRRIKLEQQQLAKEKSKNKVITTTIRRRPGRPRRPDSIKKTKTSICCRTASVSSNDTNISSNTSSTTIIKKKKLKVKKQPQKCMSVHHKNESTLSVDVTTDTPNTIIKRKGRPKGSMGYRNRMKLQELPKRHRNPMSSSEQQKENVVQQQTSSGKLKCVISTRNNRIKLLSSSSSSTSVTSNPKKTTGSKNKKSGSAYNLPSSCIATLPSVITAGGKSTRTTAKRRKLQQRQQQQITTTASWDVGRPKRYHSANHSRSGGVVEEDCCFVGSQPFEQHCPGGGGLSHNTIIENEVDHQKENTVHSDL